MRRRTLVNGAVVSTVLLAAIGVGVAVASAATSTPSATTTPSQCANVYLVKKPAGDTVGKLCTAVTASGTSISGVTVTYTASSSCRGSVLLRVSGADQNGAEFDDVKTVACGSGTATASFDPVSEVAAGTDVCGTLLLSDTYTAAQACVPIS
jgi:hypothetical protein